MKEEALNEDNFCRLSRAMIERHRCSYAEALRMLGGLRLNLVCDENIRRSVALQAALVTAINAGKRTFLGGVYVSLPAQVGNLLPWSSAASLNDVAAELGGTMGESSFSSSAQPPSDFARG
jgi:hypothetical protein